MSFSEFFNFVDDEMAQDTCVDHPLFAVPGECNECAFIHYKRTQENDSTIQIAGASAPQSSAPNHIYVQAGNIQVARLPDLPASCFRQSPYSDLMSPLFKTSNGFNRSPFPNYFHPAVQHAAPADIFNRLKPQLGVFNNALPSKAAQPTAVRRRAGPSTYPQPPKKPFPNPSRPATRHMTSAFSTSYHPSFRSRIINPTIPWRKPTLMAIYQSFEDDDYPERFALSPTEFPKRVAKRAKRTNRTILPKTQENNIEEDVALPNDDTIVVDVPGEGTEEGAEFEIDPETTQKLESGGAHTDHPRVLPLESGERLRAHKFGFQFGKPFRCGFPHCPKRFDTYARASKHYGVEHGRRIKTQPYPCKFPNCPKSYALQRTATRHYEAMHQKRFQCQTCRALFHSPSDLELHRREKGHQVPTLNQSRTNPKRARSRKAATEWDSDEDDEDEMEIDLPESDNEPSSDDDDPTPCEICQEQHWNAGNEMVLCDNCDLGFHQLCYDVPIIPKGEWYCRDCRPREKKNKPKVSQSSKRKRDHYQEEGEYGPSTPKRKRTSPHTLIAISDSDSEEEQSPICAPSRRNRKTPPRGDQSDRVTKRKRSSE